MGKLRIRKGQVTGARWIKSQEMLALLLKSGLFAKIHPIFYLLIMSTITWKVANLDRTLADGRVSTFTTPLMHVLMTKCIQPVLMVLLVLKAMWSLRTLT